MSRQKSYYPGETIRNLTFKTSNNGTAFNPSTITLKWRQGKNGSDNTATVANPVTGTFTTSIQIPNENGNIYYRWSTTNPVIVEEGWFMVKRGRFVSTTSGYS